jgi:1,4-alpha-glucan branching enzyme
MEPVSFEFTHPTATTVCVAGTFNNWNAKNRPMHPMGGGRWIRETGLPPGTYEYRLVVDGEWIADPQAAKTVDNPFGGKNSILQVCVPSKSSHLSDAKLALL